ncbi:class I SAM-dependent methyltransferase [Streptomyces chartreusis]|uniref:class I SAM-dependent methyltransferase n=1 Tax=Streptomyces chartreusis TaxID=1969 RepID=UPI002E17575B|nr:methyltransferase domain-containing protein [Streptomyces chartreusis]
MNYYRNTPSYLSGGLSGTSHFGYTAPGGRFDAEFALRAMEHELGRVLAVPEGSLVVDAGCGFGRVAGTLADDPYRLRVLGVDLVPERLVEARRYLRECGVGEGVGLAEADYCSLPVRDGSIAAVFTMETLVHAASLEGALGEFWRVLVPGGRLVLFEYEVQPRGSVGRLRRWLAEDISYRTGMASVERFTPGTLPGLLRDAGFADVTVRDISCCVWPSWRWLFWRALRKYWAALLCGGFLRPNLAGSLLIWPNRRLIGYQVVTAVKPEN